MISRPSQPPESGPATRPGGDLAVAPGTRYVEREQGNGEPAVRDLLRIQEHEREVIARELHDAAGQLLISLQLNVARLRQLETGSGHEQLVDEIRDTVALIEQEVRSLSFLRFPAELHGRDLPAALHALTAGFSLRTGIHGNFKLVGSPGNTTEWIAASLLRIAQEALVNVYRHSLASSVAIRLEYRPDRTSLSVTDNGIGIPPEGLIFGVGLKGMSHRIEELGGTLKVVNLKKGTKVTVIVRNED